MANDGMLLVNFGSLQQASQDIAKAINSLTNQLDQLENDAKPLVATGMILGLVAMIPYLVPRSQLLAGRLPRYDDCVAYRDQREPGAGMAGNHPGQQPEVVLDDRLRNRL